MKRPSKRSILFPALAMMLVGAAPAAKITKPPTTAPMSEAEYRATLQAALGYAQQEDCGKLLGVLDPAIPRVGGRNRNVVNLLRIPCLGAVGRGGEVGALYREMIAIEPDNPMVRGVGVFAASYEGDFVEAGRRLASLAEERPEALATITSNVARAIAQELTQKREFALRDRLFIALARADWQPPDRPEMRDSLAQGAIEALLTRKEVDEAGALLDRITMPELLMSMAMERHYEPLWPAIEARMGPHGATAIDRFAASRLDSFTRNPNDERAIRDAIRSYILLGRYPEAAKIAEQVAIAEGMSEEAVTSIRYHAQVLAAQSRRRQAAERMRGFAVLDLVKTPAAVSGLVGYAELLDEDGQAEAALTAARGALARSGNAISPWGAGWLRRTEVCALGALRRNDEANRLSATLIAKASDNEAAAVEGLLCIGRGDEAAKIAIATLATAEGAASIADQFQPEAALWAPAASRLRALWEPFRGRPDVRAAFDKAARILPEMLWPAREPRPIPRPRAPADAGPIT